MTDIIEKLEYLLGPRDPTKKECVKEDSNNKKIIPYDFLGERPFLINILEKMADVPEIKKIGFFFGRRFGLNAAFESEFWIRENASEQIYNILIVFANKIRKTLSDGYEVNITLDLDQIENGKLRYNMLSTIEPEPENYTVFLNLKCEYRKKEENIVNFLFVN